MRHTYFQLTLAALLSTTTLSFSQVLKFADLAAMDKKSEGYTSYVTKDNRTFNIGDKFLIGKFADYRFVTKGSSWAGWPVNPDTHGMVLELEEIAVAKTVKGECFVVFKTKSEKLIYSIHHVDDALERGEIVPEGVTKDSSPAVNSVAEGTVGKTSATAKRLEVDQIMPFKEGFAFVFKGKSQAIIDAKGNFVVPFNKWTFNKFHRLYGDIPEGFVNGSCVVKGPAGYGIIDTNGELIVPCDNTAAFPFDNDGIATILKNGRYYFVDRDKKQFEVPAVFRRRLGPNELGMERLMDPTAKSIVLTQGLVDKKFTPKGVSIGMTNEGYSVFDKSGVRKGNNTFKYARHFSEGLAAVCKPNEFGEDKWGFVNESGEIVIPLQFSKQPGDFSQGLSFVIPVDQKDFHFAFIDRTGNVKLTIKENLRFLDNYTPDMCGFQGNYALLPYVFNTYRKFLLIDKSGKNQMKFLDSVIGPSTVINGLTEEQMGIDYKLKDGQMMLDGGLIDLNTNFFLPSNTFEQLSPFDSVSGLAMARKAGVDGYVNKNGDFVIVITKASKW